MSLRWGCAECSMTLDYTGLPSAARSAISWRESAKRARTGLSEFLQQSLRIAARKLPIVRYVYNRSARNGGETTARSVRDTGPGTGRASCQSRATGRRCDSRNRTGPLTQCLVGFFVGHRCIDLSVPDGDTADRLPYHLNSVVGLNLETCCSPLSRISRKFFKFKRFPGVH